MELIKELQKKAKHISVLYVEDEAQIRDEIAAFLKKIFGSVTVAENGNSGLEAFKKHPFELVISDIKMPKLNGLAMASAIKKIRRETKIIITSAFDDKKLLLNAIERDIDHYIVKPIDFNTFITLLYKTVSLIKLEKRLAMLSRHNQAILDHQDNILFTYKNGRVISANKRFLDFFGIRSVKAMHDDHINLTDFVIRERGYFYPKDKNNWASEPHQLADYDMLIKLRDQSTNDIKTFLLKIGTLPEFDETIVTLTSTSEYGEGAPRERRLESDCFTSDQSGMTNFFTYIKNEINRTKRYALGLSVIQFMTDSGKMTPEQIDEAGMLAAEELAPMDFLARPTSKKFIILKVDTDTDKANQLAKKISKKLRDRFADMDDFQCPFGVAGLDSSDTAQDILSRAEGLLQVARESGRSEIKCDYYPVDTPRLMQQEKDLIFKKLKSAQRDKSGVKVISFYHGMKVVDDAIISSVSSQDAAVSLRLSEKQYGMLKDNDKVFIYFDDCFNEAEGTVETETNQKYTIRAKNIQIAKNSPLKREFVRVEAERGLGVTLDKGSKSIKGMILDISIKSMACELPTIKGLLLGQVISIEFSLPSDKHNEPINTSAEIYKIEKRGHGYKAVLLLLGERQLKQQITGYITKLEQKIAVEIKKTR